MRERESSLQQFAEFLRRLPGGTECTYVDWVRRFLDYASNNQAAHECA
jgi:hypothetical protein